MTDTPHSLTRLHALIPRIMLCSHIAASDADSPEYHGWGLEILWGPVALEIILLRRHHRNAR